MRTEPLREQMILKPRTWRALVKRGLVIALRVFGALVLVACATLAVWPTGRYLVRAGWEEGKILLRRRPIAELVADPSVDARTRAKLQLVLAARAFAIDSVGLTGRQSFTTFSRLQTDTLVLLASAAYPDKLESYTWWFPIVGRVPYKGYFDFARARQVTKQLKDEGFDTYLRPVSAFSTLGWFNDPLLSSTLRLDSVNLANTVIHELTHNTFYAPGQAVFNESFANFVGARGAEWFFRSRGDTVNVRRTVNDWSDEKILADFWEGLYHTLDSAFAAHPASKAERLAARQLVYDGARQHLVRDVAPGLRTYPAAALSRVRLDNASLLARRVYLTKLDLFDDVFLREGGDLRRSIARITELARAHPQDPYGALHHWLTSAAETAP